MNKFKAIIVMVVIGIVWIQSLSAAQNEAKTILVNHDIIALGIGVIIATVITFIFTAILLFLGVIEAEPIVSNDPYMNDPKWKDGFYNSNVGEVQDQ